MKITLFTTGRGYTSKTEANKDLFKNCKFKRIETDLKGLAEIINTRTAFCNVFKDADEFKCSEKTNENLKSFQLIVLDYDHQQEDFKTILSRLEEDGKPLPNIVLHGWSEGKDGEHSYKLIYVTKSQIENIQDPDNNKCYRHGRIQRGIANYIALITGVDADSSAMKDSQCYYGGEVCYINESEYGFLDLQRAFGIDTTYLGGGKSLRSKIWANFGYSIPKGSIQKQIEGVIRQMLDDCEVSVRKRYSHSERPQFEGEYRINLIGYRRYGCFKWVNKKMNEFRKRHLYIIAKDLRDSGLSYKEIFFQLLTEAKDRFAFPKDKEFSFQHVIDAFEGGVTCDDEVREIVPLAIHKKGATIAEISRNNSECLKAWIRGKYDPSKTAEENLAILRQTPCYNGQKYNISLRFLKETVGEYKTEKRATKKAENERIINETFTNITNKINNTMAKNEIIKTFKGYGRKKVEEFLEENGFDLKDRQVRTITELFKNWIGELEEQVKRLEEEIEVLEAKVEEHTDEILLLRLNKEEQEKLNAEQKGFNKYVSETITAQQHQIDILNYERLNNE